MTIDFTLPPEVQEVRERVRDFVQHEIEPAIESLRSGGDGKAWRPALRGLREKARAAGLWAPHIPRGATGAGLL